MNRDERRVRVDACLSSVSAQLYSSAAFFGQKEPIVRRCGILLLLLCVSAAGACGDDDPVAPSAVNIAGPWSGTFESQYLPEAVFMDLTQAGTSVTGTWVMSSGLRANGTVSGSVSGSQFTGLMTYSYTGGPVCQGSFSGSAGISNLTWTSPGFTGTCGLVGGNPVSVRFVMQRR